LNQINKIINGNYHTNNDEDMWECPMPEPPKSL